MPSQYLDDTDPDDPPHSAGSQGGQIIEYIAGQPWSAEQVDFRNWFLASSIDGLVPPGTPIDRLARYLGHIHKLEVGRDGTDFRYRIYGNLIAARANMRMQGRWVSELPEPACHIFLEHYRQLCAKPRLFVGELRYAGGGAIRHPVWLRADAPIGTVDAGVRGIIVLTLPRDLACLASAADTTGGQDQLVESPPLPD